MKELMFYLDKINPETQLVVNMAISTMQPITMFLRELPLSYQQQTTKQVLLKRAFQSINKMCRPTQLHLVYPTSLGYIQ